MLLSSVLVLVLVLVLDVTLLYSPCVHRVLGYRPLRLRHVSLSSPSLCTELTFPCHSPPPVHSGVAGSVVSQKYFEEHFGIITNGVVDANKDANLSGNVVSVLQAGAFFGALGSAPISGELLGHK